MYLLTIEGGETRSITLDEFLVENIGGIADVEVDAVLALKPGGEATGGGGAAVGWTLSCQSYDEWPGDYLTPGETNHEQVQAVITALMQRCGFFWKSTGGNCSAYVRKEPNGTEWLVTGEDAQSPLSFAEPAHMTMEVPGEDPVTVGSTNLAALLATLPAQVAP